MTEQEKKNTRMLDEALEIELKHFLVEKPEGYVFIRTFVRDAVREKMNAMKEKEAILKGTQ
jgi:hypothetical protein